MRDAPQYHHCFCDRVVEDVEGGIMCNHLRFVVLVLFLATASLAQDAVPTFQEFKLKDIGTILIPVTMELQAGDYKVLSDAFSKELMTKGGFEVSGNKIVFQQKGLNEFTKATTYARVMIDTDYGPPGSYEKLVSKLQLTTRELNLLDSSLKQELSKSFEGYGIRMLRWDGVSIVSVNGRSAIRTAYLRQLNDNPSVVVEMYQFQNYDRTHKLTISYRLEDSSLWKDALDRTKNSFSISNIVIPTTAVAPPQKTESDYAVYRDAKFPFTLFYPKDWTQLQPTHAATRFKIAKEDGIYFTDFNINAIYVEATRNVTPERYVRGFIDDPQLIDAMIKQGLPTGRVLSRGKTYVNNRDAYYVKSRGTYRSFEEEHDMTIYQILTILDGNIYTLTFRAPTEEFDENFPIFKFIASSFVIRPTMITVPKVVSPKPAKNR
ncbi:MAG: hypothetical protein ACKVRN_16445 [Pyrinomonadaceae bacterium]